MWNSRGNLVVKLHRVSFGPVRIDGLEVGQHRILCDHEVEELKEIVEVSRLNSCWGNATSGEIFPNV
jgi:16S rRNA U516 pseudouridylate synthase RsuA-like enzyme